MREDMAVISEKMLLARIGQSEQMREFFIQMWRENPLLAARAGTRVQEIMLPLAGDDKDSKNRVCESRPRRDGAANGIARSHEAG